MGSDAAPDQFEWVSAKAACTAASVFERLRTGVKQDVERRNALVGPDDEFRFEFSEDGEGFEVARLEGSRFSNPNVAGLVRFERAGPRIHIRSEDDDVDITAILTLDPQVIAGSSLVRCSMPSGRSDAWRSNSCSSTSLRGWNELIQKWSRTRASGARAREAVRENA